MLLGKIINFNNDPNPSSDRSHRDKEFHSLDTALSCFRGALLTEIWNSIGSSDHTAISQLQTMTHACTILLHHPAVGRSGNVHTPSQSSFGASSGSSPQSWVGESSPWMHTPASSSARQSGEENDSFLLCLTAAQGILSTIKTTPDLATGPFNPFVTQAYFVCARILVIRWLENHDPAIRADIDLIILVIDRISELWGGVASKYRLSIESDLARDPRTLGSIKNNGGDYLGDVCAPAYVGNNHQ